MFKPTEYKISTITATGNLNVQINLRAFYDNVAPTPIDGIVFAEHAQQQKGIAINSNRNKKKPNNRVFENQVTLQLIQNGLYTNCKVFKNGRIQLTGIKRIEHGPLLVGMVINELKNIHKIDPDVIVTSSCSIQDLKSTDFSIKLINTDFNIGSEIRRDRLYRCLIRDYPDMYCSYEPCIYPGVKIHYFTKEEQNRRITIAVFQSGSVLVTGGGEYRHIDEAYKFICDLLGDVFDEIVLHRTQA